MAEKYISTKKGESLLSCPKISKTTLLRIYKSRTDRQLGKDGLDELTLYVNERAIKLIDELEPALGDCNELLKYQRWQRISKTVVKKAISRLEEVSHV